MTAEFIEQLFITFPDLKQKMVEILDDLSWWLDLSPLVQSRIRVKDELFSWGVPERAAYFIAWHIPTRLVENLAMIFCWDNVADSETELVR